MTGYESKKKAAQDKLEQAKEILLQSPQKDIEWQREQQIKAHAKLDEDGMYLVHQTKYSDIVSNGGLDPRNKFDAQPEQEPWPEEPLGHMAGGVQPAQEPASITYKEVADAMNKLRKGTFEQRQIADEMENKRLYTSPPQRTWVGLTDDELADLSASGLALWQLWRAIEAKLKEKNNGT